MNIKKGIIAAILVLALCSAGVLAGSMIEYEIADLDLTLELPAEYHYVFTRDMDGDDPDFVDLGMTKESLFENASLYLVALTEDQNAEVIVTMTATDWSRLYYDFNELENSDLMEMAQVCLMDSDGDANIEITDCAVFEENPQAKFLKANGTCAAEGGGYAIQYVTVLNGNAYTVTFNFDHQARSDEEAALTEHVVSTAVFHTVEAKDTGKSDVAYIVIIATMAVIIVVLLLIIYKKHYTINGYRRTAAANSGAEPENPTDAAGEEVLEPPSAKEETGRVKAAKATEDAADSESPESPKNKEK